MWVLAALVFIGMGTYNAVATWLLWHVGEFTLYLGVVPVAAFLVAFRREPFFAVAASFSAFLLVEVEASGKGGLAGIRYVQRIDTVGGAAPPSGCDAAHSAARQDVEYRASYVFYGPRPKP